MIFYRWKLVEGKVPWHLCSPLCCLGTGSFLAFMLFRYPRVHQIFRNFRFAQNAYKWVRFHSTDRGEDKTSAFLTFHVKFMEWLMKTSRGESRNLCFRALESEYLNPKLIVLKFFIVQIKCSLYLAKLKSKSLAKPLFLSAVLIFLSLHFRCRCPLAPWTMAR